MAQIQATIHQAHLTKHLKKEADLLQNKARVDAIQNEIRGLDLTKPKNVKRLKGLQKELEGFDLGQDQKDVDAAKDDVDECQKFLREVTPSLD